MTGEELIALQARLDALATRLSGDDRMLVFEARSTIEQQAERLGRIATLAGVERTGGIEPTNQSDRPAELRRGTD